MVVINKLYNKLFKARGEIKEEIFWRRFYKKKISLFNQKSITDLDDWREMRYYNKLKELIKEALKINSFLGLRILELGSGSGLLSILMAKEGASVVLVDRLKEATEYAYILLNEIRRRDLFKGEVEIINDDIFSLKLSINSFNIVHNYGVIEHFHHDGALRIVKIMKEYSKSGGFVIVGVPNYFSPDTIFLWTRHKKGTEKYYSKSDLKNLLEKAGLKETKIITSTSVFPYFFPKWFVEKSNSVEIFLGKIIGLGFLYIGVGKKLYSEM